MHGAVAATFPQSVQPGRILWRVDRQDRGTFLYMVTPLRPDLTGFVEDHGWPEAAPAKVRDYEVVLDAVKPGQKFLFRVEANPVKNVLNVERDANTKQFPKKRGKRLAHVTPDQQLHWFTSRAEGWGFEVGEQRQVVRSEVHRFQKKHRPVTIASAVIEGALTVQDAATFSERLVTGFGGARAYGCGLMTLAKPG